MAKKVDTRLLAPRLIDLLGVLDWLILPKDPSLRADLKSMRRRLLLSASREGRAGLQMAFDSFGVDITSLTRVDPSFRWHLILAEGFFGAIGNYARFAELARRRGIQVICPYGGERNVFPWKVSIPRLIDTYHRVADIIGRAPTVSGHSKGGQDAAEAADQLEGLQKLILGGSPRQGESRNSFRWLMEQLHGHPHLGTDVDHVRFAEVVSKIDVVVISSEADFVVRPHEAHVPGARNIVLKKLKGRGRTARAILRRLHENHAGLFLRAADVIFREVTAIPPHRRVTRRAA